MCRGYTGMMYLTKEGATTKRQYQVEMLKQRKKKKYTEFIDVKIDIYFGDKRRRDVDNYNKLVLDAGNDILWEDDVLIKRLTIEKFYDKAKPRVEIFIKDYETM